jgi:hypothetical protein
MEKEENSMSQRTYRLAGHPILRHALIRQQEPESFVKADVEAQAQARGVEIRNLKLSSSEMGVTAAEAANGIERRAWSRVSFIYRCPGQQKWKEGTCWVISFLEVPMQFAIPVIKVNGVWQYEGKRLDCMFCR